MSKKPSSVVVVFTVGFLGLAVVLAVFHANVPALVISVFLACGVASLLYGILEGVTGASVNFGGWLQVGGSGAVLLGSAWLFNSPLDQQLTRIRAENRFEEYGFDFDERAVPSDGWFAIDEGTGIPVEVAFTDPVTDRVVEIVQRPISASLRLRLASEEGTDRYLVLGTSATVSQAVGYVPGRDLISAVDSVGWQPGTVYGPQRLFLSPEGDLPPGAERRWGNTECRGESMPFEIEVVRLYGFTDYDLRRCDGGAGAGVDYSSSLNNDHGELVELMIQSERRRFLIVVVAADHRPPGERQEPNLPPWSSFLVIEMESTGP